MEKIFSREITEFVSNIGMVSNYLDQKPYGEIRDICRLRCFDIELKFKTWFYERVSKYITEHEYTNFDYKTLDICYNKYIYDAVRKSESKLKMNERRLSDISALAALKKRMEEGI